MRYFTFIFLFMASCSGLPKVDPPSYREPKEDAPRLYLRDNAQIKSESDLAKYRDKLEGSKYYKKDNYYVWDLNGGILRGDKQSGDGGQSEDQEPLIRVRIPLLIKDGFVQKNKDALTFYKPDSGIEKITFTNIGEDAVATWDGAYRFRVEDCEFINDREGDKSIQLNEAKDAIIRNNVIFSGITGARVGSSDFTSISEIAKARENSFFGVDTAYNVSKITLDVDESSDKYEGVRLRYKTSNGAKVK